MIAVMKKVAFVLMMKVVIFYSFTCQAMREKNNEPIEVTSELTDFFRDTWFIWKESITNRRIVSALSASSPDAVKTILQGANIRPESNVLEIGSGTGTVTKPLARLLFDKKDKQVGSSPQVNQHGRLDAVEYLEKFFMVLKEQLQDFQDLPVNLYHADFTLWKPADGQDTTELYDAIIATIPFTQLPQEMLEAILNKALPMLKQGGRFVFISLVGARTLGDWITKTKKFFGNKNNFTEHQAKLTFMDNWLDEHFVKSQKLVWFNLPPMWVYTAVKN